MLKPSDNYTHFPEGLSVIRLEMFANRFIHIQYSKDLEVQEQLLKIHSYTKEIQTHRKLANSDYISFLKCFEVQILPHLFASDGDVEGTEDLRTLESLHKKIIGMLVPDSGPLISEKRNRSSRLFCWV